MSTCVFTAPIPNGNQQSKLNQVSMAQCSLSNNEIHENRYYWYQRSLAAEITEASCRNYITRHKKPWSICRLICTGNLPTNQVTLSAHHKANWWIKANTNTPSYFRILSFCVTWEYNCNLEDYRAQGELCWALGQGGSWGSEHEPRTLQVRM